MARTVLIILLVLSFCFLGFTIGRYTDIPSVGPGSGGPLTPAMAAAKEVPSLKNASEMERAFTLAIIASSNTLAKEMTKNIKDGDLGNASIKTIRKALAGMNKGRSQPDPNKVYDVKAGDAPSKGPKDAPVTIVEFSEFQCPFCGRAAKTLDEIAKEYEGKVRLVFRSKLLPNHSKAPKAHAAAYAAERQGKFWEMHDKIFANQGAGLKEENYIKYAEEMGLNMSKFKKDMNDPKISEEWADDMKEGDRIGVRSTPTFFINGKMLKGAKPKEAFKEAIDKALKEAKK